MPVNTSPLNRIEVALKDEFRVRGEDGAVFRRLLKSARGRMSASPTESGLSCPEYDALGWRAS